MAKPSPPALSLARTDLAVAGGAALVVAMMIIPLPPILLDMLITFNIALSLVTLLVSISAARPLEFSTLPSVLLLATLFRLSLNVSSTRLILLRGEAGEVIRQFGQFVVGGNAAVGLVVFLILVIIQFVVITKGSERVSEVAARFTLDAMPGKQMAIDSEVGAGLISEDAARARRAAIQQEADFYGAMDGASKFVKGDAMAGLLIVAVNLIGGLTVGVLQQGRGFGAAWSHFSLLTVGDGLVSQIPALLISTATGVIVTRAAGEAGLGDSLAIQLGQPRVLSVTGVILVVLGLVPGLPTLPFMVGGIGTLLVGRAIARRPVPEPEPEPVAPVAAPPEDMHALLPVDPLEVQVGFGLIPLADPRAGGDLMDRLVELRRQLATGLGLVVPYIRVRDNLALAPDQYVIRLRGVTLAEYRLQLDRLLAIDAGDTTAAVAGEATQDPSLGLPALWIHPGDRQRAELSGYTVVEPVAVVVAHVGQVIRKRAPDLLDRQEVRALLDLVKETHPALVEELTPKLVSLGDIQKVLQNLLQESVSIRDLVSIFEALADAAVTVKDPDALTERVRQALARAIAQQLGLKDQVRVMMLDPALEQDLMAALDRRAGGGPPLAPDLVQGCLRSLGETARQMVARGHTPILVTAPALRPLLRRLAEQVEPVATVLSHAELDPQSRLEVMGVVQCSG